MYESLQELLLEALKNDDFESFTSTLEKEGWPIDSEWSDYDLLMNAIKLKRKQFVTYLLDKDCRVYVKPGILTPLHFAVENKNWLDIIDRLICLKCPIDEKYTEGHGDTAIHFAYDNGVSGEIIDLLLCSYLRSRTIISRENVANDDGMSFLHIACSRPSVEVVKSFVDTDPRAIDLSEERSFYTPLHTAVEYQRYAVAEYLLQCKAKIYKQNCNKSTPLHLALKRHDFKMINLILDHDERKENVVDEFGLSHFMAACASNNEDIVKEYLRLAELRSRIAPSEFINTSVRNLDNYEGYTPLHYSVDFGLQTRTVKLLLDYGADCCAAAANGKTPHMLAKEKGHNLMCNLLNENCNVFKECRNDIATFLNFENEPNVNATPASPPPLVPENRESRRTLSVLPPPPRERQVWPILPNNIFFHRDIGNAEPTGNKIILAQLLTNIFFPPRPPPSVENPQVEVSVKNQLLNALENNDDNEFLTILQTKGLPKRSGFTVLMTAIMLERKSIVIALLDANCQVIRNNRDATTPLHLVATKVGWLDVIERLLMKGCRADDKNSRGDTPLHHAFLAGNLDSTVDILLENALEHVNKGQKGFLHIACTRTNLNVVRKFVETKLENCRLDSRYHASFATPLHFAVMYKRHNIAHYLIRHGSDIYLHNTNGSTPLHLALELRDVQMIDLILAYDSDKKDIVDRSGATHFMAACAGTNPKIAHEYLRLAETRFRMSPYTLIFGQVKNNAQNAISGYTPLHFASHLGRVQIVELLLNYGADCCRVAANGLNCHAIAQTMANKHIYRILKEHCDVVRRCRQTRTQSPDFGQWGEKYEWDVLLERTRTIKGLRNTLNDLRSMSLFDEVIDIDHQ